MFRPGAISKLFSKPVSCVAHYFCEFCKKRLILFLNLALIQVLIALSYFNVYTYIFLIPGPVHFDLRDATHRSHMFQRFHLFLASLVMSRKNIQLEWLGRGNIDDIETSWIHWKNAKIPWHCHFKFIAYRTMSPVINFYKIVICSFGDFNILCSFIDPSVYCIMLKGTSTEYYKCDV